MDDTDPDYRPQKDPASLLPYVCQMIPDEPGMPQIERAYSGSMSHSLLDAESRL